MRGGILIDFDFRNAIRTKTDLDKVQSYAEDYTSDELGEIFGYHPDTIRHYLKKVGMAAAKKCIQCGKVRPAKDFHEKNNSTRCYRHERVRGGMRTNERDFDIWMGKQIRKAQKTMKVWDVNEETLNGYAGCLGKLQLD